MTIDDRRQQNDLNRSTPNNPPKPHSIKRDPVTGNYSAKVGTDTVYRKKVYSGDGDVKSVSHDAFDGKDAQKQTRERNITGYKQGQVFNNPTPAEIKKPKKIKYVYSITDTQLNLIEFYVGGFQPKPIKLPFTFPAVLPFDSPNDTVTEPNRFFTIVIDNLGKNDFAINLSYLDLSYIQTPFANQKRVVKYYRNTDLKWSKTFTANDFPALDNYGGTATYFTPVGHGVFVFEFQYKQEFNDDLTGNSVQYTSVSYSVIDDEVYKTDPYINQTGSYNFDESITTQLNHRIILDRRQNVFKTTIDCKRFNYSFDTGEAQYQSNGNQLFNENATELNRGNDSKVFRPSPSRKTWINRSDAYTINYYGRDNTFNPKIERASLIIQDGKEYFRKIYYTGNAIFFILGNILTTFFPEPEETDQDFFKFSTARGKVNNYTIYGSVYSADGIIRPKKILDVADLGFTLGSPVTEKGEVLDIEWALLNKQKFAKYSVSAYSLKSEFLSTDANLLVYVPTEINRTQFNLLSYSYHK